jgi:subtilisin family serine protease
MTGVDKVHALGVKGKGIKIGIIDTGVDYRHPALGGGFGKGFKIEGGYDFVGDSYYGLGSITKPGPDPLATCVGGGHGTHTTGILAGQDPPGVGFGLVGVAPESTVYMYRIFGCQGSASTDIIMQAFVKAGQDGVDLISMSVGEFNPWASGSPLSSIFAALHSNRIGLVLSGGNDGDQGVYSASSPASDPLAIAVGSVSNTKFPLMYNAVDPIGNSIKYARQFPINDSAAFHVFHIPLNTGSFICDT